MAITDNLIARWQLNDDGSSPGTATTAACFNSATFDGTLDTASWTTDGTYGDVYVSAADNDIDCGSTAVFSGSTSSVFSCSFWLYPTSLPNSNNWIFAKYATVTDGRSFRFAASNTGVFYCVFSSDGVTNETQQTASSFVGTGAWQHFVVTFNAGDCNVYKNNGTPTNLTFSTVTTVWDSTTNSDLVIGSNVVGGTTGIPASCREFAFWERELGAGEVAALYSNNWGPAITSVGGDDVLSVGETGATIVGTGFGT